MSTVESPMQSRSLSWSRPDQVEMDVTWLFWLRWGAIAGQIITITFVTVVLPVELPLFALTGVIVLEALTNILCMWLQAWGGARRRVWTIGLLVFDIAALTGLLYLTGGPSNPFNFLYLVYLTLAVVILGPRSTWGLVVFALLCFGLLFFEHRPLAVPGHEGHDMHLHLRGMWVAFGVAAVFIVYFIGRISKELTQRDNELSAAREAALRTEKLGALATLAAGAAHELATPLSTIALVAKEMSRRLAGTDEHPELAEDARLIRDEVGRCRDILEQLSVDGGQAMGGTVEHAALEDLFDETLGGISRAERLIVSIPDDLLRVRVAVASRMIVHSFRSLINNALDASSATAPVMVRAERSARGGIELLVEDRGCGMSAEVLERAVEPFFTTKLEGAGMGLGLFVAHTVLESVGGALVLTSEERRGTQASLQLPVGVLDGLVPLV